MCDRAEWARSHSTPTAQNSAFRKLGPNKRVSKTGSSLWRSASCVSLWGSSQYLRIARHAALCVGIFWGEVWGICEALLHSFTVPCPHVLLFFQRCVLVLEMSPGSTPTPQGSFPVHPCDPTLASQFRLPSLWPASPLPKEASHFKNVSGKCRLEFGNSLQGGL